MTLYEYYKGKEKMMEKKMEKQEKLIKDLQEMTERNDHNAWVVELADYLSQVYGDTPAIRRCKKIMEAIILLHVHMGYMTQELIEESKKIATQLLNIVDDNDKELATRLCKTR